MIGNQDRWQEDLFVAGPLSSLIPNDHILKRSIMCLTYLGCAGKWQTVMMKLWAGQASTLKRKSDGGIGVKD